MPSASCGLAIASVLNHRRALLKFISPNDSGVTGSHQRGFYLPKQAWRFFTVHPPERGVNREEVVTIQWQDARITDSCVKWYGKRKNEYRLTRLGRGFPFLRKDSVGNLLVLVSTAKQRFEGFVLETEEDIAEVQTSIGKEVRASWALYEGQERIELPDACIARHSKDYVDGCEHLPPGDELSKATVKILQACEERFDEVDPDDRLLRCIDLEYQLFKLIEQKEFAPEVCRTFTSVDDFVKTALSILNRRKSRAGRSLENHVGRILRESVIPFAARPAHVHGVPDIVIPAAKVPPDQMIIVGVKTTCKDRWRQVLSEGVEGQTRYLITLQQGISEAQIDQMTRAGLKLVVPRGLHAMYPASRKDQIMTVAEFIRHIRIALRMEPENAK